MFRPIRYLVWYVCLSRAALQSGLGHEVGVNLNRRDERCDGGAG